MGMIDQLGPGLDTVHMRRTSRQGGECPTTVMAGYIKYALARKKRLILRDDGVIPGIEAVGERTGFARSVASFFPISNSPLFSLLPRSAILRSIGLRARQLVKAAGF